MNIKLVQSNICGLNIFEKGKLDIDFFTEKRVYAYEKEEYIVSPLFANINKLNSIAFIGKNATGKTITLNIISDILKVFIENKSISECEYLHDYFDERVIIKNIILIGKKIYKIETEISKDQLGNLYFENEILYEKEAKENLTKKNFLIFSENTLIMNRKKAKSEFLKFDDSIFSSILNSFDYHNKYLVKDMIRLTNFNFPSFYLNKIPLSLIHYLDPSVEEFYVLNMEETIKGEAKPTFHIKFMGTEKKVEADISNIENYLSSGTIKGINVLLYTSQVLQSGGYLLIDEIENHLNKSIVINIINLFTSKMNTTGATLLFTTHYSEILDAVDRSDSIYVLNKKVDITMDKFSELASNKDRNDKKKSDLILSGEVGTTPSYFAYRKLKNELKTILEERE